MNIAPVNFFQPTRKINKINNNATPSFKGDIDDKGKKQPIISHIYFYTHYDSSDKLKNQLLNDGYSPELLEEYKIFKFNSINPDFNINNPNLLEEAENGTITKDDIFFKKSKNTSDIYAMEKAYKLLNEKFNSQDVQKFIEEQEEIVKSLNALLGIESKSKDEDLEYKRLILRALYYVDNSNLNLLNSLLDDENFNNICIYNALIKLNKNKDMTYGEQVLKMAQEIGYNKKFSSSLAILIREATEENIPMIQKMLNEQEFLSEENDFACEKLSLFLRSPHSKLAELYVSSDDITLQTIDKII